MSRRINLAVFRSLPLAVFALVTAATTPASAQPAPSRCSPAPMLQPGKTQLQERVLVRPGGVLSPKPDGVGGQSVPAFSALFVYARSKDGAAIQVGASSDCKPQGWMRTDAVVPWRHQIVAAFTSRGGRDRVPFFGTPDAIKNVLTAQDTKAEAARIQAAASASPATVGIVALEPETPVDIEKQFYLFPILDVKGPLKFASDRPVNLLHVASLTKQDAAASTAVAPSATPTPAVATPAVTRHTFRTAVVFVLDATESMDPYLDRSRQALDKILAKVDEEGLDDRVRFGLVAFRDDPKAVPKIEYGTRVYADPNKIATRAAFDAAVKDLRAARVSSRAVAEDVFAGVDTAINKIDWSGFDGRYVVLVTDASAREPNSGIVTTKMDEGALSLLAKEKGIALMAVHLLTKEGGDREHRRAQQQYTTLTQFPGRGALYYQIPAGDVGEFGRRADAIANAVVQMIGSAEETGGARPDAPPPPAPPPPAATSAAAKVDPAAVAADVAAVSHAMRMAYLGKLAGSAAPTMFDSWALDKDIANQDTQSLDIRVLMSKSQLSDLASIVSALYTAFNKGIEDPPSFEQKLRSALLTLGRDPSKMGAASNRSMTDAVLGEYLDGLPFPSRVMGLDQDAWNGMSPSEQQELVDHLAVDLEIYQRIQDDVAHWVSLAPGAPPEDAVYPVPKDALP